MNERIKELAIKAGLDFDGYGYPIWGSCEDAKKKFLEKFAELIVQECVTKCDEVQAMYGQYTFTARKCKEAITEHFGVEE